jgi:hypothetical protein
MADSRFFVAQYGQDKVILDLCYPKGTEMHKGIFIEVGAWDGYDISNTYALEKTRDWKGLLVEPIEEKAAQARHNRWCGVWQGCVADTNGETDFLHIEGYSEMLSGIPGGYHQKYRERVNGEISQHKLKTTTVKRPCLTLNGLMDKFGFQRADYCSLDCQTAELGALKAYDVTKNPIKVISLDMNGANVDELKAWFKDNGYMQHWKHERAEEFVYVHPGLKWSWEV